MNQQLRSFEELWPYCVSQHRHSVNRALHFGGTSLARLSDRYGRSIVESTSPMRVAPQPRARSTASITRA